MNTLFIKTTTGAFVAISSIDFAEPHDDGQMQISTSRGKFLVTESDFNKVAGISPAKRKTKVIEK